MLVDTHCHLGWESFAEDREEVLSRAAEAGVDRVITIGTDLVSSAQAVAFSQSYSGQVYAAVGVHPTDVFEVEQEDWLEQLALMLEESGVVAIGESGLDFYHPAPEKTGGEATYAQRQEEFFRKQIELSIETGYPLVVHQRESLPQILKVLEAYKGSKLRSVFHCWNQEIAQALALIEQGHLVSFAGVVTFKNARLVHEAAKDLPLESIMIETDAPFLAPVPHRGKRAEPAHCRITAEYIAQLRGITLQEVAERTTQTAEEFFALPPN